MAFYVDNKTSFSFNREQSLELLDSCRRYVDADSRKLKLVVFEVPCYTGSNVNKQIARSNIELDGIAMHYKNRKIYYLSPYTYQYKFVDRAAPMSVNSLTYIHFTDAEMVFDAEPNAIWIVDPNASYTMILHLLRMSNAYDKIIFFVYAVNQSLLSILKKK